MNNLTRQHVPTREISISGFPPTPLRLFGASALALLMGLATSCSTAPSSQPAASKPAASSSMASMPGMSGSTMAASSTSAATETEGLQTAGELVVSLDARDPSAGTAKWVNKGTMGDFDRIGSPKVGKAGGQAAVQFNGTSEAYRSEKTTPAGITGAHPRSIEVWVNNPSFDSTEECMVAWGHRGESLANLSFNYGSGGGFSAATHYDQDMSWGEESPAAGRWHLLDYVYDGKTVKLYDNGVERGSQDFVLATSPDNHMNIAVENSTEGEPLFNSEFDDNWPLSLSGYIASVRVESGALTPAQVKANFDADKARFGATAP